MCVSFPHFSGRQGEGRDDHRAGAEEAGGRRGRQQAAGLHRGRQPPSVQHEFVGRRLRPRYVPKGEDRAILLFRLGSLFLAAKTISIHWNCEHPASLPVLCAYFPSSTGLAHKLPLFRFPHFLLGRNGKLFLEAAFVRGLK